ncbi:hypothetical protein HU200_051155 [Digitaria exilis]|uniref:F-box protein AT5G49610-like beta-propeller domain-containing protein n=1 Tax=Digitaria exilis TaxID=1010633 RepID=A0A835EAN5_9POAL|nr:hypothetical protein HU200_051155 [Digitaria exilis]
MTRGSTSAQSFRDDDDDDDPAGSTSEFKFKLVVVFYGVFEWALRVSVYDSGSGRWGEIISTTTYSDCFKPSVLVGNKLYWLIRQQRGCNFLQFDVDRHAMAIIKMSDDVMHVPDGAHVQPLRTKDGGLGFAIVWKRRMQLWGKTFISGNVVRGVLEKTVELDQLLPMKPALTAMERQPSIVGYDEENNVIFLWTNVGVFMIKLESMEFTKVFEDTSIRKYFPFASFFDAAAGNDTSSLLSHYTNK